MWDRDKPGLWYAAIGALTVALIALFLLQTRWLNELQRAERERVLEGLRRSARFVSDDVDREIASSLRMLFGRPVRPNEDPETALLERWSQAWEERNANSLLKGLYQVSAEDGKLQFAQFDAETGQLEPKPLPVSWSELGDFLRAVRPRPSGGAGFRGMRGFGPSVLEEGDSLLILIPRFPRRAPNAGVPPPPPFPGAMPMTQHWSIAELDAGALAQNVIPRLVREHVGEEYTYVLHRKHGTVAPNGEVANPDLTIDLLHGFAPGQPRMREEPGGRGGDEGPRFERPPGLWELRLRHNAGGIASLVGVTHRRNLWMSFGVLAVMAAALGLVVMNARRAAALARQQMEFVAAVSHELRTPIAAMRSAADNLADGVVKNEEQARRYGVLLRDQGRTLGDLMEQVLAFAGIASNTPSKEHKHASVPALVDDAIAACSPLISSSACEVEKDVAPGLPEVAADATWVRLALRNLVQNAVVHGGGKWLRVAVKNGSDTVQIAVEDHGQGIDASEMDRIFQPFYRGRGALEKAARGAGLGLSIARKIAEAHGGSLRAESHPGQGSRFILSLPVAKN